MREIVLDTETTGLDPRDGHRIVEIGCVELLNLIPTGQTYHVYINPERDMPADAFKVHGLSAQFLAEKQVFAAIAEEFTAFLGDARLIIHNAEFDTRFINFELERGSRTRLDAERILDSLALARRRFPGQPNSLDALCQRYQIDNSRRIRHGALLDAEILAEVYAELCGGRQSSLGLSIDVAGAGLAQRQGPGQRPFPLPPRLTVAEAVAHTAFVASLGKAPLWHGYLEEIPEEPETLVLCTMPAPQPAMPVTV